MDRETAHRQALDMLDAFASVGADRFDVTWRTMETDDRTFRKQVPLDVLRQNMPKVLDQATHGQRNVIVRPHGPPVFLQLDDLNSAAIERVKPLAFLTLDTSPGNHQAWLALTGPLPEDFATRVRKGSGADRSASGATRTAGSYNFKTRHAPDFPMVTIGTAAPGRTATAEDVQALGLVAPIEPMPAAPPRVSTYRRYDRQAPAERKWPDYGKCLDAAPANAAGDGPKRAAADFAWCMIAADWGFPLDATIARLIEQSTKAQENGKGYAVKTATRAAQAATRNRNSRQHVKSHSKPGV